MPDLSKITEGIQTLELDARHAQLRAATKAEDGSSTGREFTGIGVPWDTVIEVWGMREAFAPGSVEPHPEGVLVCWRHDEPIGVVTGHRDVDAGWEVDGRLSQTARGEEVAILLRDGVINKLSVRFEPIEYRVERDEDDDTETVIYTKAIVREVSLVPFPAYSTATVSNVRQHQPSKEPTMPAPTTETPAELDELRASVDELGRRVELINTETTREEEPNPLHQFRSFGDFVKAVASGDESATRAYNGVVTGDVLLSGNDHTWVGDVIKLVEARTPLTSFFNHTRDLPPTGMNVDYGILGTNTLGVEEQLNEGDDLVYGKISLADATARVRTIGGWTDMSRQSIERSGRNVVDLAFRGFAIAYANALEAIASSVFTNVYTARVAAGGTAVMDVAGYDADTALEADDVISLLVDLAVRYQGSTYSLDALFVAPALFKELALIKEERKLLQITSAPTDKAGTLSLSSVEANLSNVRVVPWVGAPDARAAVAVDAQAIKVQESPGAPVRLQDENIINLTKQFSVYGYVSAYSEMPEGIVPITFGTETVTA